MQRSILLEELRSVVTHPTADELYAMVKARLPRISLGTIYRNLDFLVQQGEILCLETAGTQKRFDGNIKPHHHVRCRQCGKIADIYGDYTIPNVKGVLLDGFAVTGARLEFEGICERCAHKGNTYKAHRGNLPEDGPRRSRAAQGVSRAPRSLPELGNS